MVLKITHRKPLQVGKDPVPQIRFTAAREAVDVDAPAIAKQSLHCRRAENQQGIIELRDRSLLGGQSGIDAALDQPGQSDTGEIGGDQRKNTEDDKPAVAVDEEFDALVIAKNRSI